MTKLRFSSMFLSIAAVLALGAVAAPSASAAGWVSFGTISPGGQDATFPNVVIDAQNNVTVIWRDAGGGAIYAASRPAGGQFGAAQLLGTGSALDAGISASGEVVVVWRTLTAIDYAIRPAGGANFSAAQTVPVSDPDTDPSLVVDPQGRAVVVYIDATLTALSYSVRQPGGSFGALTPIPATATTTEYDAAIAANGIAYVVWVNLVGDVSGAPVSSGGALGATNNDLSGVNTAIQPAVGIDANGNPSVVWKENVSGDIKVVRVVNTVPGTTVALTGSNVDPSAISTTTTAAGSSHVIWSNATSPVKFAQARRITAGGTLGTLQGPLSPAGANADVLDADGNPDGSVLAIWQAINLGAVQVAAAGDAQPFGAFSSLGATAGTPIQADVDITPTANGAAVWQSGGATNNALAAGYDNSNPVLNNVSVPSTGTQLKSSTFSAQPFDAFFLNGQTSWNFGDGKTATGNSVTHTWAKPGTFTVTASISDTAGNSDSVKKTIKVASGPSAIAAVTSRKLKLARNGKISVKARCSKSAVATCRGTLFLKSAKKVNISRKKTLSIGQSSYSIKQGKTGTIKIKSKRSARRYINRKRKLSTRVSITGRDGFGKTVVRRYKMTTRK